LPEAAHLFLELECSLSVFEQERVDVEDSGEIEGIIDLLCSKSSLIIENSVDLEEKSLWGILDPGVLVYTNDLSLFISVIVDVGNSDFLASLI
jgi:hypothetical protein